LTAAAFLFNFAAVAVVMLVLLNAGRLFGPRPRHEGDAELPYETGLPPREEAGRSMSALYWRYAVLFVVFDVDLAFLLPWALNRGTLNGHAVAAVTVFVGLLVFMLGYFWRKGALSCR
jgi:NADH-quinone oxidoreductase subunit A